ncbi:MAG: hypothetical protein IKH61_06905 [Bacteroidales bacterium]|nr:hypothetical protein [Bacteroidales bacterium]
MKRYLLTIVCLLMGFALKSQSVYTCQYWFDEDDGQAVTTTFGGDIWQAAIDVGSLPDGVHTLHFHVADTSMNWSSPQSFLFIKLTPIPEVSDVVCHYWFDHDAAAMQSYPIGNGMFPLNVDGLADGIHTLHVMIEGNDLGSTQNFLFIKLTPELPITQVQYHYWFDWDEDNMQSGTFGNGLLQLDVNDLEEGVHTLHVMMEGTEYGATQSFLFFKKEIEAPSDELTYFYWFDEDDTNLWSGTLGDGILPMDVNGLEEGEHVLNIVIEGNNMTATQSFEFTKLLPCACPYPDNLEAVLGFNSVTFSWTSPGENFRINYHNTADPTPVIEDVTGHSYELVNPTPDTYYYWKVQSVCSEVDTGWYVAGPAIYVPYTYNVTTMANPEIGGTITGGGGYQDGEECTVIATPNEFFSFANWIINGEVVSTDSIYSFTVTEDVTIVANFNCELQLGEFADMSPIDNFTFTSVPFSFAWDDVSGADNYDLYLWNANDPMPNAPYVSGLTVTFYSCASLPNYQDYHWYVKANNYCNSVTSSVMNFSVNVNPTVQVNTNSIDFGEVELDESETRTLYVSGTMLDDGINVEIVGNDAALFSFETASGWNNYLGGALTITFTPTVPQWTYNATLVVSSGALSQSVALSGTLSNVYVFNVNVDNDIYPMNTAIPIRGTVTDFENTPIPNMEVEIGITVMDWKRTLTAVSDESGQFSATFEPLPLESGYYTVNSGPVGNTSTEVQDSFDILGMTVVENTLDEDLQVVNSTWILCDVTENVPKTGFVKIINKNSFALTNTQVTVLSAPTGCEFTFTPLTVAGLSEGYLEYSALGTTKTQGNEYQQVRLRVTCDQGAEALFTIWFYCSKAQGILEVSPTALNTTMTKGKSKTIDVTLNNNGEVATGEITVNLPDQEWMSVVGGTMLASIAPNESATFTLRLSPDQNVPLAQFTGNIVINCEHVNPVSLPYSIMAVSDENGALVVDVTDEFTTNTNNGNGPHVEGAEVTLTGYFSHETVAHGFTTADGTFSVEDIVEGYYYLDVNADRHKGYEGIIYIDAGITKQMNVFLQYHGVSYSWMVEPTEIGDTYMIVLDLEYEVEVPVPVVTIQAPQCILPFADTYTFNYSITNHGLIDAVNLSLYVPENEHYLFTPLYDHIDTLHAHATVEIPCVVTHKDNNPIECGEWCMTNLHYGYLSGEEMMYDYAYAATLLGNTVPCSPTLPPLTIVDETIIDEGGGGDDGVVPGSIGEHGAPSHPSEETGEIVYGDHSTPLVTNQIPSVDVRVGVRFSQTHTMTREAFIGTFNVRNGHETNVLSGIGLDFVIKDEQGNDRTDLFQINILSMTGVTGIDGNGTLAPGAEGKVQILFIPTKEAAPTEPVDYFFGGTFTFVDPWNSVTQVMNLYPNRLTVHPSPDLYIDYFVAHDVYGDNPLTPETEPIIPAELAVRIWNKGAGTAKNVILDSAEPVIASNIQNLLIEFGLYGTYMDGQGVQQGLSSINFGNIEGGQTKVGEWLFTSTLLAHLISYDAHVVHNDSYGNPKLSLISHLGIHELVHPIQSLSSRANGVNDFLVNDIPDENNYPDSIYFSNGGKTSVGVVESASFDKYVTSHDTIVTLTVTPSRIGWNYGETEDPGRNHYKLLSCTRNNDGQDIPLSNIWQESVILHTGDYQNDSVYVDKLRIIDTVSAVQQYTYTLVFAGDPSDPYIFFGNEDEYWSNSANWESNAKPHGSNAIVLIDGVCLLDEDVTVSTLEIVEGKSLTIPEERTLTVLNELTNTVATGLIIEDGGQLRHSNAEVMGTVQKAIEPYTSNNNGWYLVGSPLVGNTALTEVNNLLINTYDLYSYDEPTHYWMNQKLAENNFTEFENGIGYLYGNLEEVNLEFEGELQNGAAMVNVPLSFTSNISLSGFNLVGNPFAHKVTSYASVNVANGCFMMNDDKDDLIVNEICETNPLMPAEGFFVKATDEGASVIFNSGRSVTVNESGSIRVELSEKGKLIDRLIVKRECEPLEKLSLNEIRTKLFATQGQQEMAIIPCVGNEQPINFKTAKDGTYTIDVNANGMEFNYFHLIDNLTGNDIDLLTTSRYTFEAKTSDYASRFLLRFIMCEGNVSETESFVYIFNDKMFIANEGRATLQVIDLLGHILSSEQINGSCEKQIKAARGIYVFRLINGDNVKTQKIEVR